MDNQKKDASRGKYIPKIEAFVKNTISSAENDYRGALEEKNAVAAVGAVMLSLSRSLSPLLFFAAAYMLSGTSLAFGTRPLGLAFVSAAGKRMLWSYAGAVIGALAHSASPAIDIAAYTLVICLRRLTAIITEPERKLSDFEDSLKLKLLPSLIASTSLGAYGCLASDFTITSLFALLFYIAVTPTLTFLFSPSVSAKQTDATVLYRETSLGALTVAAVISLRALAFELIDPSVAASFFAAIYVTRKKGILKGALLGVFLGMSGLPMLAPVYSVAAIVSGLLFSSSPYLSAASATLACVSWTVYSGGYELATASAPSLIFGGIAVTVAVYGGFFAPSDKSDAQALPSNAVLRAEILKNSETDALLASEARAFAELSEMLSRLSERLCRPTLYDIKEAVRRSREALCRRCDAHEVCRKLSGEEISDAWASLSDVLYENGRITEESLPVTFASNCRHSDEIIDCVNEEYAHRLKSLIDADKTEVMALDYRAVSSILSDLIRRRGEDFGIDAKLSEKLSERLKKAKISADGVSVYGASRRTVFISALKLTGIGIGQDELCRIVSEVCGGAFSPPEFELRGPTVNATLRSREAFSVLHAAKKLTEAESRSSGDSQLCFSSSNGHFYALISDGMGTGHEAAMTSGMCILFIEKMLCAGSSAAVTLRMLNSLLRARGIECSASVDLYDLDLTTGDADFYKSGAVASLIIRGSDIFRVESKTLPVGIISSLDAQKTRIKAELGDVIVMMSDGISEDGDDASWLYSLLSEMRDRKCADIASAVIAEAERRNKRKDDATVCVLRVAPSSEAEYFI